MTQRQLTDTALKILSLYFLVRAIGVIRDIVLYLGMGGIQNADDGFGIWLMFGGMSINLITNSLFFWIFAFKSNNVLVFLKIGNKNKIEEKELLGLTKVDWLEIGIVVVGIIAVTFALPEILYKVADSIYFKRKPSAFYEDLDSRSEILYSLFKLLIGLIVMMYSRQISKAIMKRGEKDDLLDAKLK